VKICDYAELAIKKKVRRFYLTSGTRPYMKSEDRTEPMGEKDLVPAEIYSIMDEFLEADLKERLLNGEDVETYLPLEGFHSLRIRVFRQRGSLGLSVKIVESNTRSLEDCSFPHKCSDSLLTRTPGLVIVSGMRDSGRSTTARAMLSHLAKKRSIHAICYERIPESSFPQFQSSMVSRRLISVDVPNLQESARLSMREDMDVFLLEDMEDLASFKLALELSSRGVLVLATMTARDLSNVLLRLIYCYGEDRGLQASLAKSLLGITHQTRIYSKFQEKSYVIYECFRNYPATRKHIREHQIFPILNFMRQAGKPDCLTYHRGYEDLVANEVLDWESVPEEYRQ